MIRNKMINKDGFYSEIYSLRGFSYLIIYLIRWLSEALAGEGGQKDRSWYISGGGGGGVRLEISTLCPSFSLLSALSSGLYLKVLEDTLYFWTLFKTPIVSVFFLYIEGEGSKHQFTTFITCLVKKRNESE